MDKHKVQKAAPKRKPTDTPNVPNFVWSSVFGKQATNYSDSMSAEQAMSHPVVFRVVHAIATTVASVRWYAIQEKTGSGNAGSKKVVEDLNDLLNSPNDSMNSTQLKYWLALNMALYHKVFFKIGTGISDKPTGIYPLETKHISYELQKTGGVSKYIYGPKGDSQQEYSTRRLSKDGKGWVSSIHVPNLQGHFGSGCEMSHSPLKTVGGPATVVRNLLDRAVSSSSGSPTVKYLITTEKTVTDKQYKALKDHTSGLSDEEEYDSQVLFLKNTKVDVHKLDSGMSDIHSRIPLNDMTRMIAGAFGYPIALLGLGAEDAAKYASNYSESKRSLYEETIIPNYLMPIADGMNEALGQKGIKILFDLDSIPALAEHRMKFAKDLQALTYLTEDEKREILGFEPRAVQQENNNA